MRLIRGTSGLTLLSLLVSAGISSIVLLLLATFVTQWVDRQVATDRKQEFSEVKVFMLKLIQDPTACKTSFTQPTLQAINLVPGAPTPIVFNHRGALIQDGVTLGNIVFESVRVIYEGDFAPADHLHSAKFEIKAKRVGGDPLHVMNHYSESIPMVLELDPTSDQILSCGFTPTASTPIPINGQALCNDNPAANTRGVFGNLGSTTPFKEITSYQTAGAGPKCFNNSFMANDHILETSSTPWYHVMDTNPGSILDKPQSILYSKDIIKVGGDLVYEYTPFTDPVPAPFHENNEAAIYRPDLKFSPLGINSPSPDMICFGSGPTTGCPEQRNNYFNCSWDQPVSLEDGVIKGTTTPAFEAISNCSPGKIRVGDQIRYSVNNGGSGIVARQVQKTQTSVRVKPQSSIFTNGIIETVAFCCQERP